MDHGYEDWGHLKTWLEGHRECGIEFTNTTPGEYASFMGPEVSTIGSTGVVTFAFQLVDDDWVQPEVDENFRVVFPLDRADFAFGNHRVTIAWDEVKWLVDAHRPQVVAVADENAHASA